MNKMNSKDEKLKILLAKNSITNKLSKTAKDPINIDLMINI